MIFVTGCDAAFFNTLLITLQSFSEKLSNQVLLVCDFGLHPQQAHYLRSKGMLLERPLDLPLGTHVTGCKAALVRYLNGSAHYRVKTDIVIWIDADFTFLDISMNDFEQIVHAMNQSHCDVVACGSGFSIEQMSHFFADPSILTEFKAIIKSSGIDANAVYFSTGIFFCRSEKLLQDWDRRTSQLHFHPLYEQNMFNIVLQENAVSYLDLDIDVWQAQGSALDKITVLPLPSGRAAVNIDNKSVKILHSTSPFINHLWVGRASLKVQEVELAGNFKLIAARPIIELQLNLLASYLATHKQALFDAGVVKLAPNSIKGYEFVPFPEEQNRVMGAAPELRH